MTLSRARHGTSYLASKTPRHTCTIYTYINKEVFGGVQAHDPNLKNPSLISELQQQMLEQCTVIREIFVVKKLSYSSKSTKIKHTKYFQRTYYVIERELNYHKARKFFNTNILHTNIS